MTNDARISLMRTQAHDESLLQRAHEHAVEYLRTVEARPVFPSETALAGLAAFDTDLPEEPTDPTVVLDLLHKAGSPATVVQTGGRYFGFVNGSILPAARAARWLTDVWDQNAVLYLSSPVVSEVETVCEGWLVQLLGLPAGTGAGFVSGTSTATLCGLAAGRDELLRRNGWDTNARGLFGAPEIRVVLGAQAHSSVYKALSILGFGGERLISVPVDEQGRLKPDCLPDLDNRTLLILQAGNVNSGAFDSFPEICGRARAAGAWIHVDGAFGLWAAASRKYLHLTRGVDAADSWSADAHKTLNAPYDNGIVFCRTADTLMRAMHMTGSYIAYSEKRDGMRYTLDMSRRARAVEVWACLLSLGCAGLAELVDSLCDKAALFAELLRAEDFSIRNEVCFNQILVACKTPAQTQAILKNIQRSGECWCGGATWQGEPVIRISVCSFMTTEDDIRRSVRAFVKARKEAFPRSEQLV